MTRKFALHTHKKVDAADFAEALNEEQLAVATAPGGPMLVVAGAGTGKTRALTYRLAWLVRAGVDPGRILLVTFTNRAAREMVHRVELLVEQETRHLWAGTFHHVANRILRQYGSKLGISPEFTILDREDASGLLKSCVPESGVRIEKKRFPQKNVLMEISSFLQNTLQPLEEVLARRYPMFADQCEDIQRVLELYAVRKRERQFLDYDDLLSGLAHPPDAACGRPADPLRPVPAHPGGRVPGHERDPGRDRGRAGVEAPERLRRRGRLAVHLQLPRRELREHPAVQGALPGRPGVPARDELPLRAGDPGPGERQHRAQRAPAAEGTARRAAVRAEAGRVVLP